MQVLEEANDPQLTTELAQFNIEANLDPLVFGGDCLTQMEAGLNRIIKKVRDAAAKMSLMRLACATTPIPEAPIEVRRRGDRAPMAPHAAELQAQRL